MGSFPIETPSIKKKRVEVKATDFECPTCCFMSRSQFDLDISTTKFVDERGHKVTYTN